MKPEEQINKIVEEEYLPLSEDLKTLHSQMRADTALKRNELREMYRKYESKEKKLRKQRKKVAERILEIWKEHFDEVKSVLIPAGRVVRCSKTRFEIRDIAAIIDAFDRADKLDLVSYEFDVPKVKKLFMDGKLEGLPDEAVKTEGYFELMVKPSEGES